MAAGRRPVAEPHRRGRHASDEEQRADGTQQLPHLRRPRDRPHVRRASTTPRARSSAQRTGAKVGWTIAAGALTAAPGGEEKLLEIRYGKEDVYWEGSRGDDFVGVQAYSSQQVDANGLVPHPQHPDNTLVGTAYRPDSLAMAVRHATEVSAGRPDPHHRERHRHRRRHPAHPLHRARRCRACSERSPTASTCAATCTGRCSTTSSGATGSRPSASSPSTARRSSAPRSPASPGSARSRSATRFPRRCPRELPLRGRLRIARRQTCCRSPVAAPSSPAAAAGSARRSPSASPRPAPPSRSPTSTKPSRGMRHPTSPVASAATSSASAWTSRMPQSVARRDRAGRRGARRPRHLGQQRRRVPEHPGARHERRRVGAGLRRQHPRRLQRLPRSGTAHGSTASGVIVNIVSTAGFDGTAPGSRPTSARSTRCAA